MRLSFTTIIIPTHLIHNVHSDRPIVFYVPVGTGRVLEKGLERIQVRFHFRSRGSCLKFFIFAQNKRTDFF